MRVTVIHRFFWPDAPPYARILRSIAAHWAREGHEVRAISAQPGYNAREALPSRPRTESIDGFTVERVRTVSERGAGPRQAVNMIVFPLSVAWRLMRGPRPDVVMCSTVPQVTLGALVSWVATRRGAAFVYHCMDLHPEIGVLSGEFAHPVVRGILARVDLATMRRASRIVVLSQDMAASVTSRDPDLADRVVLLNNFSLPDDGDETAAPLPPPGEGVLRAVFAGNLGRFQGLADLVRALPLVPSRVPVELVFMGEGKARAEIEQAAADLPDTIPHRVRILPHGSVAAAKALMRSAHVGVVSLVPDVVRYAYPSKTATYAEQGLPMLVVCEKDAELAASTVGDGLGWAAESGDIHGIAAALTDAAFDVANGTWQARSTRVRGVARLRFAEEPVLDRWSELLRSVVGDRSPLDAVGS